MRLLPRAGVPFTEVVASQLMPSAEDVTSSCELGIIEIELSIHSPEIMVSDAELDADRDAAARTGLRRACKLRGHRWKRQAAGSSR